MRRHRGVLLLLLLHLFCITLAPVWAEPNDYGTSPHSNEQLSQQKRRDARDLIDDTLVLTEVASSSNASSGDSSQPENKNNQDNATQKTSSDYSVLDKKAGAVKAEVKTDESASEEDIPEVIPEVIVPGNITVCCSKVNDLKYKLKAKIAEIRDYLTKQEYICQSLKRDADKHAKDLERSAVCADLICPLATELACHSSADLNVTYGACRLGTNQIEMY